MFKRNLGRFNKKIALLKPSTATRDELGGLEPTTYEMTLELLAMVEDRDQTRRQVVGDYVTTDTKYFVVRDIRNVAPGLNNSWRLRYNGYTFIINKIELIDESRPYFLQLTATAVNNGGAAI